MITRVMLTKALCLGVLALVATAQDIPTGVKYDLAGLAYPHASRLARIEGVVRLELIPNEKGQEVRLIGGHTLLAPQARENLAQWSTNQPLTVNYIFKLTDPEIVKVRVPRGDAFDRLFLRMFHLATYTEEERCRPVSSNDRSMVSEPKVVQQSPLVMEVEIALWTSCIMTHSGLVASR